MTRSRKRKLRRVRAKWASLPLASALLAGAPSGFAQQGEATGALEEIIVTAQKRTEDLQKVPISMQVLGQERMDQLQITSFDDYAKFLPSVSFQTLGPGQAQLYFRGIASGGDGLHAGSLPATGLYVDEIPVTTIGNSLDLHVYDIQRVEALAGPQGTLYGASSLSGTLRIITNKPDPAKFEAGYDVKADKYGRGNPGGQFEGFVNVPLAENAAVRLVGYVDHDGGYISNVPATRTYQRPALNGSGVPDDPLTIDNAAFVKNDFNTVDTYGGRAALKVDLDDRWTVTPAVIYQHQRTNGTFGFDPQIGDLKVTDFEPDSTLDQWWQTALTVEGKISNYDLVYTGGYFGRQITVASDYSEYSVAYDSNGYSRFRDNLGNLLDPTQAQVQTDRYRKVTQELRLSSPATDRFHFTVGAFYQMQSDVIRDSYLIQGLGNNATWDFAVPGQPNTLYLTQQERVDRDYALFGDATFELTDQLKVSGGIRGFVAHNTLNGFFGFNDTFVDYNNNNDGDNFYHGSGTSDCLTPVVTNSNAPCQNTAKSVREHGETHRINGTYQIDPDRMVYVTYSTGFRPGGNNRRVGLPAYRPDTLTNYEFGWKTSWFDNRLRWNGAVFYEVWKDVQLGVTGPNGITDIWNIGNAEVKGVEGDLTWRPFEGLELSASGTYVNARTTTSFCGEDLANVHDPNYGQLLTSCPGAAGTTGGPSSPEGSRLPVTPELKGDITARYTFTTGDNKNFLQATVLHQSAASSILDTSSEAVLGPTPAYTSADFSLGTARDSWTVELYVVNAFDDRGQLNRFGECGAAYCYQNARIYPIKPQMFGVKFGEKF